MHIYTTPYKRFSTLRILATVKQSSHLYIFKFSFSTLRILATVKQNVVFRCHPHGFSTLRILATVKREALKSMK